MPAFNFSPYDAQQREIDRRAQYAELLRQQGMEAPQGGMAGRIYVGPSWTQGLAQMLKAYGGGKGVRMADEQSRELASDRTKAMVDALKGYGAGGDATKLLESPDTAAFGVQAMGQERQAQIDALTRSDDRRWRTEQDIADRKWRTEQELLQRQWQAGQNDLNRNARIQAANMGGGAPDPYYQFLPGADGYLVGNARTGQITPGMVNDHRAVPGTLDPTLQGQLAGAKESGKLLGKTETQAQIDLPGVVAGSDQTVSIIDQMLKHPGLEGAVGMKNWSSGFGLMNSPVSGSKEADFMALRDQLGGKQFLEAFESLKGGGQITQVEGEKATNAIARMQTAQSEEAFKAAADEFRSVVVAARDRAVKKAQGLGSGASGDFGAPVSGLQPGAVEDGFQYIGGDPSKPESWKQVSQ